MIRNEQEQVESMLANLRDPAFVHVNLLAGGIAKPTPANIWHIYGKALLDAIPPELSRLQARPDASDVERLRIALVEAAIPLEALRRYCLGEREEW